MRKKVLKVTVSKIVPKQKFYILLNSPAFFIHAYYIIIDYLFHSSSSGARNGHNMVD